MKKTMNTAELKENLDYRKISSLSLLSLTKLNSSSSQYLSIGLLYIGIAAILLAIWLILRYKVKSDTLSDQKE